MVLQTRPKTAQTDYVCAPWYLRLRWWIDACIWHLGHSFEEISADSADLVNPLWRR
ncbi:MAG: hypothetical protein HGA65_06640 [Oscillochloris sp.]|nr:hypothetical protein [Oscillochloris sp.]